MKKIFLITLIGIYFILPSHGQSLTMTSPNGGENWLLDSVHPVTWTATNIPAGVKVKLILFKDGARVGLIADALAAGAPYNWTVGQNENGTAAAGGGYTIRVRSMDNAVGDFSNQSFAISDMKVISRTPPDRLPPPRFKFPRLEVSKIDLTPNVDGFGIIFNYKNVGEAPLPKASEVPLKPSYRVLIDGRETAKGFLFIPAFAAQPGWEQKGYFGGWIVLPTSRAAEENNWHIGTTVTVHINENQVMGMKSHTLSLPLKPIALKYKCDALITGVSLNWQTRVVTVSLRVDGMFPASGNINLTCSDRDEFTISPSYKMSFFQTVVLMGNQHFYTISRKLGIPEHYRSITLYVKAYAPSGGNDSTGQAVDMDYRNNFWKQCKFVYPDSNPVR